MIRIVLLGAGNVATHLFEAIQNSSDFQVVQVFNHKKERLKYFSETVETTSEPEKLFKADLYLLALKDDAIADVAEKIPFKNIIIAHTSGGMELDVLRGFENRGVFYPLQTFSENKEINFKEVPVCIEAKTGAAKNLLFKLAHELSHKVFEISSAERKSLHVAAVFVSNFVNYLYTEAAEICKEKKVPFEILHPLILETAKKIQNISPKEAQTGPAKRNDLAVINAHLELLNKNQQEIYNLLTASIQKLHGKKL